MSFYTPVDGFPTSTSNTQRETENVLARHQPPTTPTPAAHNILHKQKHMQYLVRNLVQGFPERYQSQDASQPWLMFWTLQAFSILQVGLDPGNRQRAISTILAWQHPKGGFGGGPGQAAHLLTTYASVCALAIAGKPGPGGGWDEIDRKKLYEFYMSLKQPDGSFTVSHHAEVDVRGIYCLLVVATLLDIMTPELVAGTADFLRSCQTYEGGFASASQPYFGADGKLLSTRPPLGEAHGGYTFCALASWVLLRPYAEPNAPDINHKNLLRWLVQMQGGRSELGGFKGRTNKLVDGCYSWWVGGAFALFSALEPAAHLPNPHAPPQHHEDDPDTNANWDDVDEGLYDREALQEYVLWAGQHSSGGLRDKPPKGADAYHTQYVLAGLSSAQHRIVPDASRRAELEAAWADAPSEAQNTTEGPAWLDRLRPERKRVFIDALSWWEDKTAAKVLGGPGNTVNASHPLFDLTITHAEGIMGHFYGQTIPVKGA
ncbi:terpenoid cyclases/Protein prenyltransferase [Cylindrobasidium torrendii FP15055 ss-10]|uniref:Protein farnesyltransferase subunit beta n=1 Tax=Cylindrobasidium torrendii FP15055 ss-10 TaxID=1314674 RepID=A0A0D7BKW0_9AGAR|nr:terpenoid cyclases/Protein prenyltransferase [Cylindrobasidium torrendii FP15055 ss-10]